jgi:hypothetical protein
MQDFTNSFHALSKANEEFFSIEKNVLDSSFLGIFKKKNYRIYTLGLQEICQVAIGVHQRLELFDSSSPSVKVFLKSSKNFAYSLNLASLTLASLSHSLERKSQKIDYSMSQYRQDLEEFSQIKISLINARKTMLNDYELFALNIMQIDCFDTSQTPSEVKKSSNATTRIPPKVERNSVNPKVEEKSFYPRKMTEEEIYLEKKYLEQVIHNTKDKHVFNTSLKKSIDIEAEQIKRLTQLADEQFKLEVAKTAMSMLYAFKLEKYDFSQFDNLNLKDKSENLVALISSLNLENDLSDASINSTNRENLKDYFVFNLVSLFFQAHMIANPLVKENSIDMVIGFLRGVTRSDIKYSDYS